MLNIVERTMDRFNRLGILPHNNSNGIGMWPNEQESLVWLVQNAPAGDLLEIGTFCGGSAILMALAAPDRKVVTIDVKPRPIAKINYETAKVRENIKQVVADSEILNGGKLKLENRASFAFIDGFHNFRCIVDETEALLKHYMVPGGIIAWHDASPTLTERFSEEYLNQRHNDAVANWQKWYFDDTENFLVDEAICTMMAQYNLERVEIPVQKRIEHYQETRLREWVRGTTSPYFSLFACRLP